MPLFLQRGAGNAVVKHLPALPQALLQQEGPGVDLSRVYNPRAEGDAVSDAAHAALFPVNAGLCAVIETPQQ